LALRVAIVPETSDPAGAEGDDGLGPDVVAWLWAGSEAGADADGTIDAGCTTDGDWLPHPAVASATRPTATHRRCRQ